MSVNLVFPFVSILVPVRNEANYLARCLNSIQNQDYPPDCYEVILADGMSTDGTRQIATAYQAGFSRLILVDNPRQIVSTGLNLAFGLSSGEIVIRVDGHCQIAPDYLSRCVQHLQSGNFDGVGGSIETVGETWMAQAIAAAMRSPFGVGNSAFRTQTGVTRLADSIPFPAYTQKIIQKCGSYDEELVRNQDDEYNYRLRSLGAKLLLAADVHSTYYSRGTLRQLWRQYFQYGFWKVRVLQKHPRQMILRQFIPPLFALSLLFFAGAAILFPAPRLILGIEVGIYLLAGLIAAAFAARRHGWRFLPVIPLIFSVLHLSYGLGFLVGMVRFRGRWGDQTGQVHAFNSKTIPSWSDDSH